MKIEITLEEALMLNAMKQMRKIYNSDASRKSKENATNQIYFDCMELLDERGLK